MTIPPEVLYTQCATACAGFAAITDLRSRRIPNWLTAPSIVLGLGLHLCIAGPGDAALAMAAGLIAGAIFLAMFVAGGMGAGDVKLMAAVGCFAGIHSLRSILIVTAVAGAVAALGLAAYQGRLNETLRNVRALITHHNDNGLVSHPDLNVRNLGALRLPYAVPIAAGCLVTMLLSGSGSFSL